MTADVLVGVVAEHVELSRVGAKNVAAGADPVQARRHIVEEVGRRQCVRVTPRCQTLLARASRAAIARFARIPFRRRGGTRSKTRVQPLLDRLCRTGLLATHEDLIARLSMVCPRAPTIMQGSRQSGSTSGTGFAFERPREKVSARAKAQRQR